MRLISSPYRSLVLVKLSGILLCSYHLNLLVILLAIAAYNGLFSYITAHLPYFRTIQ
jgi:hypothetical protein